METFKDRSIDRPRTKQTEVRELNWRKHVTKSGMPPALPEAYFELTEDLSQARLFSFLRRNNAVVTKSVKNLGDGQYCLDYVWTSDYLKVLRRKNEMNLIFEFARMAKGRFSVTLVHSHRRFSLSNKIGIRVRRT
tara:strand:+ start:680 stop:1084 length:405 start_codon:yes stop_codon:yes gene_type:complete